MPKKTETHGRGGDCDVTIESTNLRRVYTGCLSTDGVSGTMTIRHEKKLVFFRNSLHFLEN